MHRILSRLRQSDRGMISAEYSVGTVAACGLAGVLYELITSDWVESLLKNIISKALDVI